MKIPYVVYPQEGGYIAETIGSIVVGSEGETVVQAKANLSEAVELYFESVEKEEWKAPTMEFDVLELA